MNKIKNISLPELMDIYNKFGSLEINGTAISDMKYNTKIDKNIFVVGEGLSQTANVTDFYFSGLSGLKHLKIFISGYTYLPGAPTNRNNTELNLRVDGIDSNYDFGNYNSLPPTYLETNVPSTPPNDTGPNDIYWHGSPAITGFPPDLGVTDHMRIEKAFPHFDYLAGLQEINATLGVNVITKVANLTIIDVIVTDSVVGGHHAIKSKTYIMPSASGSGTIMPIYAPLIITSFGHVPATNKHFNSIHIFTTSLRVFRAYNYIFYGWR